MRSPSSCPRSRSVAAVLPWGVLAATALGGCSGGDGARARDEVSPALSTPSGPSGDLPTGAPVAEFCAVTSLEREKEFDAAYAARDWARLAGVLHSIAADYRATGTPAGIPAATRDGLWLTLRELDRIGPDELRAAERDGTDLVRAGLSEAEVAKVEAYDAYLRRVCPDEAG
ncbi:hypothetical protein [Pimelobacter sp. 30-1]|uniref:hypothetical protein n=1 Tax=Pimelobacter sp. 30-1 TaxID=2004991 RepID=UPI001C03A9D7|nr:hypothetical protein [Pimelobacter sp. 30-1]MBU2698159.1 hypothetical protein [Pimelobacter sp. 30-1]